MRPTSLAWLLLLVPACSGGTGTPDAGVRPDGGSPFDVGAPTTDTGGVGPDASDDAAPASPDATAPITADQIRAALGTSCTAVASTGLYATDSGDPETVPICQGPGAVIYWQSDLDVDCDGGRTSVCMADPWYLPDTSTTGSDGLPIDAETVPYVVIPLPSARFTYGDHGIDLGQIALVTYQDRWAFGVFADEGPEDIIGEASYAMASTLGIDPDPATGGADAGATFVIFTGAGSRVSAVEDHAAVVAQGMALLDALLGR